MEFPIFASLDKSELVAIFANYKEVVFQETEFIYTKGSPI